MRQVGILVTGAASGAHMNPAVSVAQAVWGRWPIVNTVPTHESVYSVKKNAPSLNSDKGKEDSLRLSPSIL